MVEDFSLVSPLSFLFNWLRLNHVNILYLFFNEKKNKEKKKKTVRGGAETE